MACGFDIGYCLETTRVQTAVLRIKCQPLSDEIGWLSSPICSARVPCNELMYSDCHDSVLPTRCRNCVHCGDADAWSRFSGHLIKGGLHLAGSERPQVATSLSRTAGDQNYIKSCSGPDQSASHAITPHISASVGHPQICRQRSRTRTNGDVPDAIFGQLDDICYVQHM